MTEEENDVKTLLEALEGSEVSETNKKLIASLKPHEIELLRKLYGLDKDISGEAMVDPRPVTPERIQEIEEKMLTKLRNRPPSDSDPTVT